jgi:hypothetical protein
VESTENSQIEVLIVIAIQGSEMFVVLEHSPLSAVLRFLLMRSMNLVTFHEKPDSSFAINNENLRKRSQQQQP